ncbi:MAG: hypothetical protein M1833_002540 [Piccolia ochrophora]|nr:MAG: hypothetical protein M1833_002540 [Piccolia ochrophora]
MASDKRRTAVLRETIQDLRDENEQLKRLMADMCSAHRRNDEAAKNRALQCLEAIGYSKDSVYAMPDVMQGVGRPLDVVNDVGLSPTSFSASGASAATTLPYYQGTSGHSHSHGPNYATFPPQLSAQTVTSGNTSDHSMSIELLNEHFQFDHDVQERANDTTTGHQLHYRPFQR